MESFAAMLLNVVVLNGSRVLRPPQFRIHRLGIIRFSRSGIRCQNQPFFMDPVLKCPDPLRQLVQAKLAWTSLNPCFVQFSGICDPRGSHIVGHILYANYDEDK